MNIIQHFIIVPAAALTLVSILPAAHAQTSFTFNFDSHTVGAGAIQILPANFYSVEPGYGFEPGAHVFAGNDFESSTNPFYFSVKLPEGNYRVTAVLGGDAESTTTVKA